jgi:hypothetical protein
MKAIIITDINDYVVDKYILVNELKEQGIEPLLYDWESLLRDLFEKKIEEKVLFYRTIYSRIVNPVETLKFAEENNFDAIYFRSIQDPIVFNPQKVMVEYHKFSILTDLHFTIYNGVGSIHVVDSKFPKPPIFVTTHNRFEYFKMTFEHLIYSLQFPYKIKVFCNGSTEEYRNKIIDYVTSHENIHDIELVYSVDNVNLGAANSLIKFFDRPENVVLMEDDVIIPQLTRYFFPNWPVEFCSRLSNHDIVGFICENHNRPLDHTWPCPPLIKQGGWYEGSNHKILPIMGQCIAIKSSRYLDHILPNIHYCATDEALMKASVSHCAPWLRPYHIGWNQKIDGSLGTPTPLIQGAKFTIYSLKGYSKEIDLASK